jgi:hypothetical protein
MPFHAVSWAVSCRFIDSFIDSFIPFHRQLLAVSSTVSCCFIGRLLGDTVFWAPQVFQA